MKRLVLCLAALAGVLVVMGATTAKAPTMAKVMAAENLKWEAMPGVEGVQVAMVSGNMAKGAYQAFVKLPPNQDHPLHTHTYTVKCVVLAGAFKYTPQGGQEVTLGPGSYLEVPGHSKHASASGPDGVTMFQEQSGPWDMKPVAAAAAAK